MTADRRAYYAERRAALRGGPPRVPQPCGTYAAARRHQRAGEGLCEPCRAALAEHQRAMHQRRKG